MFIIGIILLTDINIGSSLTRFGSFGSNSISGSFLTGVLAVIVASPCTAPFMGAALGYALIQPSSETLPIFASLGVGFSLPYLILSLSPGLIKSLPGPGQWMVTLKEFFAFPMFATSLWLIWVFSLQTNTEMLISLLIALLVMSTLFWSLTKLNGNIKKSLIWIIILIIIITEGVEIISSDAKIEADKIIKQAENLIQAEKNAVINDLKDQVAELSINIAEKVLKDELNNKVKHEKLVERLLKESNIK